MQEVIKGEKQTIVPITSGTNPTCKISQSHSTKCTHTHMHTHRVYTIVLRAMCFLIRYEYNKVHYLCRQYLLMVGNAKFCTHK